MSEQQCEHCGNETEPIRDMGEMIFYTHEYQFKYPVVVNRHGYLCPACDRTQTVDAFRGYLLTENELEIIKAGDDDNE